MHPEAQQAHSTLPSLRGSPCLLLSMVVTRGSRSIEVLMRAHARTCLFSSRYLAMIDLESERGSAAVWLLSDHRPPAVLSIRLQWTLANRLLLLFTTTINPINQRQRREDILSRRSSGAFPKAKGEASSSVIIGYRDSYPQIQPTTRPAAHHPHHHQTMTSLAASFGRATALSVRARAASGAPMAAAVASMPRRGLEEFTDPNRAPHEPVQVRVCGRLWMV